MPEGYDISGNETNFLPWSYAEQQLREAVNYWVATVRPDGRPHAMPTWGVWLDGKLYIEGSPETRRFRNIAQNPAVVVHLESGNQVVILEGKAQATGKPSLDLAMKLSQEYSAKYSSQGYSPAPENWDEGGLYEVTPQVAFGWTKFPDNTTRWTFA
jgi:uncharacterized pyridoxamine 5'-phosphate oxidase family protein